MTKTIGIYHDKDLDGLMCAAIMKRAIPDIELIGWDYLYDHKELINRLKSEQCDKLYMADLSLPPEMMYYLKDVTDFYWIDHHKTAIDSIDARNFAGSLLNTDYAACELCWMYLFPGEPMPNLVEFLGKYDTWRKDDEWDSITLPIQMYYRLPGNFDIFILARDLERNNLTDAITKGTLLVEFENGILQSAWNAGQESFINVNGPKNNSNEFGQRGYGFIPNIKRIPAYTINTTVNPSRMLDVCGNEESDILCTYYKSGSVWKYSLRSLKSDVGEIAKQYGGGGHKHAAGFQLDYLLF